MRHLMVLLCLAPAAFAGTWSGILVDANCYQAAESNVNPTDTSLADRDMDGEVASCHPTRKTKTFAIVEQDWTALKLDRSSGAKAADIVRNSVRSSGKKAPIYVTVTGERHKNTIAAASLSLK
jgi:hypothetical protein